MKNLALNSPAMRLSLGALVLSIGPVLVAETTCDPLLVTFGRMSVGVAVFGASALISRRAAVRKMWWSLAAGALLALDLVFFHHAVSSIGPGISTIINNLHAVLITCGALLLGRSSFSARAACGAVMLTFLGLFLLHGDMHSGTGNLGLITALLSACFYAASVLIQKKCAATGAASRDDVAAHMAAVSIGGAATALVAAIFVGVDWTVTPTGLMNIVEYGVLSQVLGWYLVSGAITGVSVERAGFLLLPQPVGSVILEIVFLDTGYTARRVAGAALILGSALVARNKRGSDPDRSHRVRIDSTPAASCSITHGDAVPA